jgi:ankyrin repeat protein
MPYASSSSTNTTSSHASSQGVPSASSVQSQYAYLRTDPNFKDKRVDWLQKEQLLLEGCNYDGETPLILAAAAGDLDSLKTLLECGANHKHRD